VKVGKRKNIAGESEEDGSEEDSEESDDGREEGEDQDEANDSDSENEAEIWKVSLHVMGFTLTKIIFCSS
jgi:hypothetical protein